jgi:hypothetical protein
MTRLLASRQTAKASGSSASSDSPPACAGGILGLAAQLVVRELELRLQRIDLRDRAAILFDQPFVAAAEDFLEKARDHRVLSPASDQRRTGQPRARNGWIGAKRRVYHVPMS